MGLQAVFSELYSNCEQDWIAIQLTQQCLPSWVHSNGTYDYIQAEIQRACELPEHHFNRWWKFDNQYFVLAKKRYAIHLRKLKLYLEYQRD